MAKVGSKDTAVRRQLNRLPVAGKTTIEMPPKSLSSRSVSLDGEQKRVKVSRLTASKTYVPVLSADREVLMPTTAARARKWIKSGKAIGFFRKGMFCVRLNVESGKKVQPIAVGIDPGSKWEGYTVKSEAHTYLNIQADAVTWVKEAVASRAALRSARRRRKTPCRAPRYNRMRGRTLSPSTKARWQWKVRISKWLCSLFPVDCFVVEDIKAPSKGQPRWDRNFSPLEVGKKWFYEELGNLAGVETLQGYETFSLREQYGLKKSSNKSKKVFSAHCVDSWVLANWYTGGHTVPDNESVLVVVPLRFHRRQLHAEQPAKKCFRRKFGGTRSLGLKRGSIVKYRRINTVYVGGTNNNEVGLCSLLTGKRIIQHAKIFDIAFLAYNTWRSFFASGRRVIRNVTRRFN